MQSNCIQFHHPQVSREERKNVLTFIKHLLCIPELILTPTDRNIMKTALSVWEPYQVGGEIQSGNQFQTFQRLVLRTQEGFLARNRFKFLKNLFARGTPKLCFP